MHFRQLMLKEMQFPKVKGFSFLLSYLRFINKLKDKKKLSGIYQIYGNKYIYLQSISELVLVKSS